MSSRFPSLRDEIELRLCMPVDPLTRVMMDADGVSASEMEALMRRVSQSLAMRSGRRVGVADDRRESVALPTCANESNASDDERRMGHRDAQSPCRFHDIE